jgi:hypothetical protein
MKFRHVGLFVMLTCLNGLAQDTWPGFRGPGGDGVAPAVRADFA